MTQTFNILSNAHVHWWLAIVLEVRGPRAGIHDWAASSIHKLPKLNVTVDHLAVVNVASVHFDEVDFPLGQTLSVNLQVIYRAWVTRASLTKVKQNYSYIPSSKQYKPLCRSPGMCQT